MASTVAWFTVEAVATGEQEPLGSLWNRKTLRLLEHFCKSIRCVKDALALCVKYFVPFNSSKVTMICLTSLGVIGVLLTCLQNRRQEAFAAAVHRPS